MKEDHESMHMIKSLRVLILLMVVMTIVIMTTIIIILLTAIDIYYNGETFQ
jgi:hypothetical protein